LFSDFSKFIHSLFVAYHESKVKAEMFRTPSSEAPSILYVGLELALV